MILESLNQLKDNNNYKSIHLIILNENNKITFGRGQEADVTVNDISVSRIHTTLHYEKGKIYLRDMKSKFGSLVLIKNEIEISKNKIQLQIGRTFLEASCKSLEEFNNSIR